MLITSKDNEKIKEIKKLKQKKYRKDRFIVEGIKMIREAIEENVDIKMIVIRDGFNVNMNLNNYSVIKTTENVFNELTDVVSPQGIIAVVNKPEKGKTINEKEDYLIAIDGIQDPGNLGTIIRTADAGNIKQIIVSKDTVDCYSPKVIRSTMGAIYRVKVIEVDNLKEKLEELKEIGFEVVTTEIDGKESFYEINYSKKIVVIGNEANGVTEDVRKVSDYKVKIPMIGRTESLNAAVAGGLMIYEYVRQKLNY